MDLLNYHTELTRQQSHHIQRLLGQWQLIADLSFSDLSLWVLSQRIPDSIVCVAQCRPTTATSVHLTDRVGEVLSDPQSLYSEAVLTGRIVSDEQTRWMGPIGFRTQAIPVRFQGQTIAVLGSEKNVSVARLPSSLEIAYLDCAGDVLHMITTGNFPGDSQDLLGWSKSDSLPKVGDGFIRINAQGIVVFASSNAVSAYRKLGYRSDLGGTNLAAATAEIMDNTFDGDEILRLFDSMVKSGGELLHEIDRQKAAILLRGIALIPRGQYAGAMVLIKDITDIKTRDRALLSKDAIIREIHHRVKNNLQSVSSLLRLQARRTENNYAQHSLQEAVRRVEAIARVHDILAISEDEQVDFDEILAKLIPVLTDITVGGDQLYAIDLVGKVGIVNAQQAMPMAMVLTELIQNAVEHGFGPMGTGKVTVECTRESDQLTIIVRDNGRGLPAGFSLSSRKNLGLNIVVTLVQSELGGEFTIKPTQPQGTEAVLSVPL